SIIDKLTNYFKPELLNRFDDIVEFNPLTKENLQKIVGLMIDEVNGMLAQQGLFINVTDKAKAKLVDLGYNPAMGARPLRRVIQEQIEDKVADFYLDHEGSARLTADVNSDGNITITTDSSQTNPSVKSDKKK
ncbi:hypothetical protein HMPREF0519_0795, partial [Lentilactobacillus hilgardii DSM 20176 = ATCC 8290]